MSAASVLHGVDVGGTAFVLPRPGVVAGPPPSTAIPVSSIAQQLEQRYLEGVRDGRLAAAERADADREAAFAEELARALARSTREGHAQGREKALEEARKAAEAGALEVQRRILALEAVAGSLTDQARAAMDGVEDELVALCHDVICRILGKVAATPAGILALVRQGLQGLPGQAPAVHLHPDDFAILNAGGTQGIDSPVRWVADSAVSMGGALLRSEAASLDARLETQLKALGETLRQTRLARRTHDTQAP